MQETFIHQIEELIEKQHYVSGVNNFEGVILLQDFETFSEIQLFRCFHITHQLVTALPEKTKKLYDQVRAKIDLLPQLTYLSKISFYQDAARTLKQLKKYETALHYCLVALWLYEQNDDTNSSLSIKEELKQELDMLYALSTQKQLFTWWDTIDYCGVSGAINYRDIDSK